MLYIYSHGECQKFEVVSKHFYSLETYTRKIYSLKWNTKLHDYSWIIYTNLYAQTGMFKRN